MISPNEQLAPTPPEDDPVLTAYALGELPKAEAAAVELRLQTDEKAREFVAALQDFSGTLAQEAQVEAENERDAGLTSAQRRELRHLIAKRAPKRAKFPRAAVISVIVSILLALLMMMLWWAAVRRH